ncbi:MAG: hypothetical protein H7282_06350 [Cytophagaceae bacterium]|nr:hypothetical protein [Cytophagaceae bacterium]
MKKIIGIFLVLVLIASCRNKEPLGPTLKVNILQPLAVSTPSVDFSTGGKVFFTAVFENSAAWTITIKGNGATKVINGVSKEINEGNSSWIGTVDVPPSFIAGSVTAVLSFQIDPLTNNVPFTISAKRIADKLNDVLVTDFTSSPVQNYSATPTAPGNWPSTYPLTVNTNIDYVNPDGNAYELMGDVAPWQGSGSPFVDIVTISPRNSIQNYGTYYPILYTDPSQVYFNIMVYNTGTPVWLEISFFEVEGVVANGTATPDRHLTIKPNWTGWKMVSVKYSDLIPSNAEAAANIQPQKITDIQIVLLSNVKADNPALTATIVRTAFDHITFTHKAPYQP